MSVGSVGAQWSNVGGNVSLNNAYGNHYSSAIDSSNTIYTAFADLGNQYVVTVRKFNGFSWQTVGTPGFITGGGLFYQPGISIAINPADGLPYIALSDGDHDDKISVMRFNGTAWEYVGQPGSHCRMPAA